MKRPYMFALIGSKITYSKSKEVFEAEQTIARKMVVEMEHPIVGKIKLINSPVKLASVPVDEYSSAAPAPVLGQHTDEVLRDTLGYTAQEVQQLKNEGVITTT